MPASTPPPMVSPAREASGTACRRPMMPASPRMAKTAASSNRAAATRSTQVGTSRASVAVTAEPQMAPKVAPAAMKPNRRLPCSVVKTSTIVAQKIETTNRLKIESQTKKARPTQSAASPSVTAISPAKTRMLRMKNR
jgi:hypothetical protein